ncbi:polysaccharide pyruvyl transferase family protein [Akkermansiaceae bacterium]|nr:polysaccharide pyruvyl transferase family protein [Akkermansiaceae bacterium]
MKMDLKDKGILAPLGFDEHGDDSWRVLRRGGHILLLVPDCAASVSKGLQLYRPQRLPARLFVGAGMGSGPKISYAPSFGSTSLDDPKLASLSPLLAGFEAISVRDENSLAIVESLTGRRPDLVVDPVLLSKPDKPIKNAKTAGAIGTYLMGPSERDVQRVCQFAAEAAKDLCSIGYHYSWATHNIAFCDPTDVPGLLAGCDLVVTNTFHGVVFSLKNRLPFIIVSHPSKDQKIDTFRRKLGLSTVTSETERIHENHVNQLGSENQILAGWIDESKGFLERHLSA